MKSEETLAWWLGRTYRRRTDEDWLYLVIVNVATYIYIYVWENRLIRSRLIFCLQSVAAKYTQQKMTAWLSLTIMSLMFLRHRVFLWIDCSKPCCTENSWANALEGDIRFVSCCQITIYSTRLHCHAIPCNVRSGRGLARAPARRPGQRRRFIGHVMYSK